MESDYNAEKYKPNIIITKINPQNLKLIIGMCS
jgi:hypothetical protein